MESQKQHNTIAQDMHTWNINFLDKFCKSRTGSDIAIGESSSALFSITPYPVEVDVLELQGGVLESVWRFAIALENSLELKQNPLFDVAWDFLFFLHAQRKSGLIDEVLTKTLAPENSDKQDGRFLYRLEYAVSRGIK